MRHHSVVLACLVGSVLAIVPCTVRADAVTVTQQNILDYSQLGTPGYLDNRDLVINSATPAATGPIMDVTFTKQYAKLSQEFFTSSQNWTGATMLTFVAQNLENRTVRVAFIAGKYTDINNLANGIGCTVEMPPNSTKRYALNFQFITPSTYGLKRLPLPYDGDYTSVANFTTTPLNGFIHWRFSNQDNAAARVKFSDFHLDTVSYDLQGLVDSFFQYSHNSWVGKVTSSSDIIEAKLAEDADLNAHPVTGQLNGSTTLPNQGGTGKWRTARYNNKWYFVTPTGKLFWSFGLSGIHESTTTSIENRAAMFESLPSTSGPNADLYGEIVNSTGGTTSVYYTLRHNLRQKFGTNHYTTWESWARRRLDSWGINTIGAFAHTPFMDNTKPYVTIIRTTEYPVHIITPASTWGPPPDPFAPDFQSWCTTHFISELEAHNGKSNFIGTYVDNELSWGTYWGNLIERNNLGLGVLASPRNQPAKLDFIRILQRKYRTIERLNTSWRRTFASWDALNNPVNILSESHITGAMQRDFKDYGYRFAAAYFTKVRLALTTAGLTGLYLGCRFYHETPEVLKAAANSVDVLTFNDYNLNSQYRWPYYNALPKPVMISEWSCPVNDNGTFGFHNMTFEQRGNEVTEMLASAASQPNVIGVHWFEMYDHPVTNRGYDYENIGFGVLDVTDSPHQETVNAFRNFATQLYNIRN